MKQGTLEWPSELQSSILSDRQSSKSQKDGLYVENVPFADKECQQEGPQKRQWSLFIYLFFCQTPCIIPIYELKDKENHVVYYS